MMPDAAAISLDVIITPRLIFAAFDFRRDEFITPMPPPIDATLPLPDAAALRHAAIRFRHCRR